MFQDFQIIRSGKKMLIEQLQGPTYLQAEAKAQLSISKIVVQESQTTSRPKEETFLGISSSVIQYPEHLEYSN